MSQPDASASARATPEPVVYDLDLAEDWYRVLFAAAPVAQVVMTTAGEVLVPNAACCELTGHSGDELVGRSFAAITAFHGDRALVDVLGGLHDDRRERAHTNGRIMRPDGVAVDVRIDVAFVRAAGAGAAIASIHDLTELPERFAETDVHRDPLTGLINRTIFQERLEDLIRARAPGLAVLFLDLDRFKQINDRLGHHAGDVALVEVSQRLRGALRPDDLVCRFGGDEFTILCTDVSSDEVAVELCERIVSALSFPFSIEGHDVALTASVGAARANAIGARSAGGLLRAADQAMYEAKQRGRGSLHVFSAVNRAATKERSRQAQALRRAIDAGELEPFFQPVIRLDDFQVAGVEALVRWNDPERGLVGPEDFIGVAEQTGLVIPLGSWMLRAACTQAASWMKDDGVTTALSVNLSARQLAGMRLFDEIQSVLRETGFPAERLCLEITESALMEDVDHAIESLVGLKALGVRLAVDDFGTGYSSFNYLRRLPVDVVKIDRAFIAGLGIDSSADAIVAAVANLSHALGLLVVAEGVETSDQLVALRALGCEYAQGFLWSPPLPAAAIRHWQRVARPGATPTFVDVRPLIAQRVTALKDATGRVVVLELPDRLPTVQIDPDVLRTIVDHLLGNAARYSQPDQPIAVHVSADRRWLRLTVSDFGIGMSPDEVRRCFEPFWQAPVQGRRPGGAGVGLYIVRSLIEAMGGTIRVNSAPGRGSTFALSWPVTARTGLLTVPHDYNVALNPTGVGAPSVIHEFMRQLGVPAASRRR